MQSIAIDPVLEEENGEQLSPGTPNEATPSTPTEKPMSKGRQRLLKGLQRISSSPSLAKLARTRSSSNPYRGTERGSMSCVSLASSSPFGSYGSYQSELSAGYSTAPTSVPGTPGPETPLSSKPRSYANYLDRSRTATIPSGLVSPAPLDITAELDEAEGDYFAVKAPAPKSFPRRPNFNFWEDMPFEVRLEIFRYLRPKQIVRCSTVSKAWYRMCFDGQLWSRLDASEYYQKIPADSLVKIITNAGPFVRDLNLRGCIQLREWWDSRGLAEACRNLENFSLEGCKIETSTIRSFLMQNPQLVAVNLSGLKQADSSVLKMIAKHCPRIEELNVSWCKNIKAVDLKQIVESCLNLKELRAGEIKGWGDVDLARQIFERNTLERLVLTDCQEVTDEALSALVIGVDSEVDVLTERAIVPPRRLKHLDLTNCRAITDDGFKVLAHNLPLLEGLQLNKCNALTDASLNVVLPTLTSLTHLDLEEVDGVTNATLQALASAACSPYLSHLSISYCEQVGDPGVLPILRSCAKIATLDMDNTRISDLVLIEAASIMRTRNRLGRGINAMVRPEIGMRLVVYDCSNVTWSGVHEILCCNDQFIRRGTLATNSTPAVPSTYSSEVIALKCFYNWQPTVEEHTKRILRGDFVSAKRLRGKWHDWMMFNEEAGASGTRHRRRRARRAQAEHADEEDSGTGEGFGAGPGRRRRARSGPAQSSGCVLM